MTFSRERLIRFSHCDPGGIVYFVHFFDMMNGVVEDGFREAVGLRLDEMHLQRRWGVPIVDRAPWALFDRVRDPRRARA